MVEHHAFCTYCGQRFDDEPWPRTCARCQNVTFLNPIPVAVVLVPVDSGLLTVRRGLDPGRGRLALPGGFISLGETWQEAGAREVFEETGVRLRPASIREFGVRSAPDDTLLVFGLASPLRAAELPPFKPDHETLECLVLTAPAAMAFPLHAAAVKEYFDRRGRPVPSHSP